MKLFTYCFAAVVFAVVLAGLQSIAQANPTPDLESWRVIEIGTGPKNADEYYKALKDAGFAVNPPDDHAIFRKDFRASNPEAVELVKVSSKDLGFPHGAGYKEIYAAAAKLGLGPCPADVGPQLRLVYTDQPVGEKLLIAMDPYPVQSVYSVKDLRIFIVANTGKTPSLEEGDCTPESDTKDGDMEITIVGWDPKEDHGNDVWVFAK